MYDWNDEFDHRPIPEAWEQGRTYLDLLTVLQGETDRGQALSLAHFLDSFLVDAISAYAADPSAVRRLTASGAPASSFSSRINLAAAMGLVDSEEAAALHGLREVRNAYAHAIIPQLDTPEITKATAALATYAGITPHDTNFVVHVAGLRLVMALLNRAHHANKARLVVPEWPMYRPTDKEIELKAEQQRRDAEAKAAAKSKKIRPSRGRPTDS